MDFRNFPMVPRVVFGRGSFVALEELLSHKRKTNAPFVFLVDDVFEKIGTIAANLPAAAEDMVLYISTEEEPKTTQVDALRDEILQKSEVVPSGVIGIGGGSIMDLAKAVSLMLTNSGSSADYQGWDLVKQPGVYHVAVPTISGTGAEVSRTAVLTGPEKKLGLNSDYTPFDQVLLDPELTHTVPKDQWFYTGMDCYIHCIESLNGTYLNAFSQSHGEKAYELCKKVFLGNELSEKTAQDQLMMASWHGGMSIAYSQVGVAHAMSYGLSYLLGTKHGVGNCIVFDKLDAFYPEGVVEFRKMQEKQNIPIPQNVCGGLSEADFNTMIDIALSLEPLWENACGKNWKEQITRERLRSLYELM